MCVCNLYSGLVPLHNACSYGHYEVAELLVRHGASVNVADLWKFTPLHEAAAKGKYEICKLLLKVRPAFSSLTFSTTFEFMFTLGLSQSRQLMVNCQTGCDCRSSFIQPISFFFCVF